MSDERDCFKCHRVVDVRTIGIICPACLRLGEKNNKLFAEDVKRLEAKNAELIKNFRECICHIEAGFDEAHTDGDIEAYQKETLKLIRKFRLLEKRRAGNEY